MTNVYVYTCWSYILGTTLTGHLSENNGTLVTHDCNKIHDFLRATGYSVLFYALKTRSVRLRLNISMHVSQYIHLSCVTSPSVNYNETNHRKVLPVNVVPA